MNNIILIGMPGSGKSTVGVLLAKITGRMFVDTDLLIQQAEGKKLYEIIRDGGSDYFAEVENRINASVNVKDAVVATGGSVVYCGEAMEHLKRIGTVVYLKVSCEEIIKRVRDLPTRGVVMQEGYTICDLYEEREPLYEKYADVTVSCGGDDISGNAKRIAAAVQAL